MQSLFAVACDHLQAPLPRAEPPAGPNDPPATGAAKNSPDQMQQPLAPAPAAVTPVEPQAGSTAGTAQHSVQGAAASRRGQPLKRPASGRDLLAAAVARSAGAGPKGNSGGPSQQERAPERQQQPAGVPRIDSAALRALLLEEGDAEPPGPSHADASQNGTRRIWHFVLIMASFASQPSLKSDLIARLGYRTTCF